MPDERDSEPEQLNTGHFHEVMDRSALMMSTWEREVEQLPATQAHGGLREAAAKTSEALAAFYALAGAVFFDLTSDEEEND